MHFIYPYLLWALAALAIPILIHLFHFRRFKKVYFTNVKFLREIKEEKSTRRRLRNFLILLCRLLIFTLLVLAFAQPIITKSSETKKGKNYVSIFIDNSFSMMAVNDDVPLLDKAKKKAEEILNAYGEGDEFQILTHEMKSSQQRWLNKENSIQAVEEIELNPEVSKLSTVHNKQLQSKKSDGNHICYYLSDFQKSITDFKFGPDTLSEYNIIPLQSVRENNISIDSAWFESAVPALNQNNKLLVRLNNRGNSDQEDIRLSISLNGQKRPEGTLNINSASSKVDTINLLINQPGWQELEIKIEDYPIQFDDSYYLSFNVKEKLKVLVIHQNKVDSYITAVFKGLNNFELTNQNSSAIQYDQLAGFDLIILQELSDISTGLSSSLNSYVEEGGNVLVFPSNNSKIDQYNDFFNLLNANDILEWSTRKQEVFNINTSEFIFENVFSSAGNNLKLPITNGHFVFSKYANRPSEYLLKYRNGDDFISKYNRGKGHLFVCVSPLDQQYNNLVLNAEIFVPLLYKAAYASAQSEKMAFTIGTDNQVEINHINSSEELIYSIVGNEEFIPGQTNLGNRTILSFNNMITEAGFYKVMLSEQSVKTLATNYDRIESSLQCMTAQELMDNYSQYANTIENSLNSDLSILIKEKDNGIALWRWCIILALLFLAIETILLKFWKI